MCLCSFMNSPGTKKKMATGGRERWKGEKGKKEKVQIALESEEFCMPV